MSKIICSICGTSYPETSTQCPICGCVRPADSVAVSDDNQQNGGYNYVKGGRFSKTNVKKRGNSAPEKQEKALFNKKIVGLAIVLLCLVVIVVLMFVFIFSRLSGGNGASQTPSATEPQNIPCTKLRLSQLDYTIKSYDEIFSLRANPDPGNTTDEIRFESSDITVAKVSTNGDGIGKVECVGPGKAVIKVRCGTAVAECRITCEVESREEPPVTVKLMRNNIDNADYPGKVFYLYNEKDEENEFTAAELTWISEDEAVATVKEGVVTVVGEGATTIRVEYNGLIVAKCDIVCDFTIPDNGEDPEGGDPGMGVFVPYSHYGDPLPFEEHQNAYSVSLKNGEWVGLSLRDPSDPSKFEKVVWEYVTEGESGCVIDADGAGVTYKSSENCYIMTEYNGTIYIIVIHRRDG